MNIETWNHSDFDWPGFGIDFFYGKQSEGVGFILKFWNLSVAFGIGKDSGEFK